MKNMKFEDIPYVHNALNFNNPQKRVFIKSLEKLSPKRAKEMLNKRFYHPFYKDPLFEEAKALGISKSLVLEAARWVSREHEWKNLDIQRL